MKPFIDIKLLPNGELVVFEEDTSDLVKYDTELNENKKLQGKKKINLEGSEIVTTLYGWADKVYIWLCGDNSIGLVNPSNFVCDLISNFFGTPSDNVMPFTVIASDRMKKAMGVYIMDRNIAFVFLTGKGLVRKLQRNVLKGSRLLVT